MLQELLENDKDTSWKPTEANEPISKAQTTHSNGFSSDSSPSSRNSNFLPHYRFHGLAETQTQSHPYDEDEAMYEGSQKENIGAVERNKDSGQSFRPPSPHAASPRNAPGKVAHVDNRNGFLSTNKVRLRYCSRRIYGHTKISRKLLTKHHLLFPFNPLSPNLRLEQIQPNKPLVICLI